MLTSRGGVTEAFHSSSILVFTNPYWCLDIFRDFDAVELNTVLSSSYFAMRWLHTSVLCRLASISNFMIVVDI